MTLRPQDLPLEQSFTIRPMRPVDVPAVAAIDKMSFPTPWPASSYLYELLENIHSFYSVLTRPGLGRPAYTRRRWYRWMRGVLDLANGDEVAGYVGFRTYRREAHVTTIAVHPTWRGRGLGELLLLETMEKTMLMGIHRTTLEVRPSNEVAQRMYQKYGFTFTGTRKGYYNDGEDAWLMAVELNDNGYRSNLRLLRVTLNDRLLTEDIRVGQPSGDSV